MDKVNKLKEMMQLLNEGLTRQEFVTSFGEIIKVVKEIKADNATEFRHIKETLDTLFTRAQSQLDDKVDQEMKGLRAALASLQSQVTDAIKTAEAAAQSIVHGKDGLPGKDADPLAVAELVKASLPPVDLSTVTELQATIEELKKEIDELKNKPSTSFFGASSQLEFKQAGTKKFRGRTINFVSGATVDANGNVTISGGSGATYETPTGTVDGVNPTFTVTNTPLFVIVDGVTYFENNGYTKSGLTITTSVPPTGFIRSAY